LPPNLPVARLTVHNWFFAAIFFVAGVWLYNRHNDFPCFYHPDEPGKARQLITGRFNFNHPLLLLQTTRAASWISHPRLTPQPVTETGRMVSAIFAAGLVFIRQKVSPNATIAQGSRVGLPSRTDPRHVDSPDFLEQKIVGDLSAVGSIDDLRARGIRYVPYPKVNTVVSFCRTTSQRRASRPITIARRNFTSDSSGRANFSGNAKRAFDNSPAANSFVLFAIRNRHDQGGPTWISPMT
jgi:hypothetical protein